MKGLYAIPLGVPFLSTLAHELIAQTASNPLSLAKYLIILPTRRGCLMLQDAFLKATTVGCRILPRIIALADIEEGADIPGYLPPKILPPAIPSWQRLGLLSQLVLAFESRQEGGTQNPASAVRLANDLIRLVDEIETSGLELGRLKTLVGADYAKHWQITLDFLKILTDLWPPILEQAGYIEPAARKRIMLEQIAEYWQPSYPVILAGTTATRPATARLAEKILTFEKGSVVLAGADKSLFSQDMVDRGEEKLSQTHPQYALKELIRKLSKPIVWIDGKEELSSRSTFLSKAMMPTCSKEWSVPPKIIDDILSSITAIEAPTLMEEARQIALIIRYELEKPDKVIALVTPDTELMRRVQASLKRWGVQSNLSSGIPLTQSSVGRFLALSSLLTQDLGAVDLLGLLKHSLFAKGGDRLSHLEDTRRFELEVLRNLQPANIHSLPFPGYEKCVPLLVLNDGQLHPFGEFLKAHAKVAEALVGNLTELATEGRSVLWQDNDGEVAFAFWEGLLEQAHHYPPMTGRDYPAFLRTLMAQEIVRDPEGVGSRVLLLGTLEARLLQSDVVILGGLNEGKWPKTPDDDPWLSRSMREAFGLPAEERKIGLSAYDFCSSMAAHKVYITRSLKRDGAPTLSSRWWRRLHALALTGGKNLTARHPHVQPWAHWSYKLDEPKDYIVFEPPAPCPPLSTRPKKLSVTEVETLLQDPYSIYAKKILKLLPLDPLDADLSRTERGQAIHQVLDTFIRLGEDPASSSAMTKIESLGREAFGQLLSDPRAMAFWWPRFQRLSEWFLYQMIKEQADIDEIRTEVEGSIDISTSNGPIILSAKADRIDIMKSKHARIIDYKTGTVPSSKFVKLGYAPQLPLEGVILKFGGFSGLPSWRVDTLAYWRLTGGSPAGEVVSFGQSETLISKADQGVRQLFENVLGREVPLYACPDPDLIPSYHDYSHLERIKEWQ